MYKTKKELYAKAKEYGLKNVSRLNKRQLEDALLIHLANIFFNDIAGNTITVSDDKVEIEPVEVIDISNN
jgi:hypothetical protein